MSLRIAYDATAVAGSATGIGAFTAGLLGALRRSDDVDLIPYGITTRGRDQLRARLDPSLETKIVPVPASVLLKAWSVFDHPKISSFVGSADVYHGTNFVVPPTPKAAGSVITVHDLTSVRYPEMCTPTTLMYPRLIQRAINRGAYIQTPTFAVAEEVRAHFDVDPSKVVAIHHGLDAVANAPRTDDQGQYLIAVGTIEPRKDYATLIRAFDLVGRETEARLVILGTRGWQTEHFDAALARSQYRDRIDILGYVDTATRNNLLANATALVYPSIYEGFGLPPLEAMQLAVPVVATDVAAVAEVTGGAARLVTVGDEQSLATAMIEILNRPTLRAQMIKDGLEQVKKYSWQKCGLEMTALYERAKQ